MHISDLNLGPLRVRWDFVLVAAGVGVVSGLGRQDPAAGLAMTLARTSLVTETGAEPLSQTPLDLIRR